MPGDNEQYNAERCRGLWVEVLAQAYGDLGYTANDRNYHCRLGNTEMVRTSARHFLKGDSKDFSIVCFMAGVEPDRARKFAVKKLDGAA